MPYITQERRNKIRNDLVDVTDLSVGDLNYIITTLLDSWVGPYATYVTYNSAIGVLEAVKLELYRRVVAVYEDKKRLENGDVYGESIDSSPACTPTGNIGYVQGPVQCSPKEMVGSDSRTGDLFS